MGLHADAVHGCRCAERDKSEPVVNPWGSAPAIHHGVTAGYDRGGAAAVQVQGMLQAQLSHHQCRFQQGRVAAVGAAQGDQPGSIAALSHHGAGSLQRKKVRAEAFGLSIENDAAVCHQQWTTSQDVVVPT